MKIGTIDIGFAEISVEIMDENLAPGAGQVVVGLRDKESGDYIQDLCVVEKALGKKGDCVNVYVYADEYTENYTTNFVIRKFEDKEVKEA